MEHSSREHLAHLENSLKGHYLGEGAVSLRKSFDEIFGNPESRLLIRTVEGREIEGHFSGYEGQEGKFYFFSVQRDTRPKDSEGRMSQNDDSVREDEVFRSYLLLEAEVISYNS